MAQTEAFVTLTNMDEENILLSLFAKKNSNAKLITKVTRIAFDDIVEELDLGSVIYPKNITADYILALCPGYGKFHQQQQRRNAVPHSGRTCGSSGVCSKRVLQYYGCPLKPAEPQRQPSLACINHNGNILIPKGQDKIQVGDTVIVVTTIEGLNDLKDILKK